MQGQNTEANMTTAVDYTRPAVTPPDETKSEGTLWPNEQPSTSTDPVKEPVHQGENAGPLPQESIKWQVYNPDESSDQMECDAVVLTEFPSDDLYTQLSDFDFDTFDCLVISLKTHATDASLYSVELADGYAQISGLVFRQSYDPTQRHFLFAVAVPKGYSLWEESVFDWNLTGDASSFYDSASYATTVVDIIY